MLNTKKGFNVVVWTVKPEFLVYNISVHCRLFCLMSPCAVISFVHMSSYFVEGEEWQDVQISP